MKGEASATKLASPTPTTARARRRDVKPHAAPEAAAASNQTPRPSPIRRSPFQRLEASEKMGLATSRPTMKAAGRRPTWNSDKSNAAMMPVPGSPGLDGRPLTPLLAITPLHTDPRDDAVRDMDRPGRGHDSADDGV